jgi:hypothetical protein
MRQRNQIEFAAVARQPERPAYYFIQFFERKKLGDRKFADWKDKPWLKKIDFVIHPRRAIANLVRGWNAVAARSGFTREAAADRCEINPSAQLGFTQMTEFIEPTEECSARRPSERPAQDRLFHARRLTDKNHLAENRTTGNRRGQHARTAPALQQMRYMPIQQLLFARP